MKKKTLKIVSLALTTLLAFTACGSTSGNNASASEQSTEASDTDSVSDNSETEETSTESSSSETEETSAENSSSKNEASAVSADSLSEDSFAMLDNIEIPEGEKIVVGYLAQNEADHFCVIMGNALKAEAEKYNGQVEVIMSDAQNSATTQISQAEDMAVRNPDVVIICAIDREACAPAVSALADADIPIVTLNTPTSNVDLSVSFVGTDAQESGRFAMEIMAEALGEEGGTVNIIQGVLGHPGNEDRMIGVGEVAEEYENITLGATQAADWDRNKAMNIADDWISGGAQIEGVIAMNDEMAISAASAFQAAGRDDIVVVGIDAIEEALELVKEGKLYGTVYQDAVGQGATALNVAVCAALDIEVEDEYLIPYEKVTIDNVDDYLGKNV